MNEFRQRIPAAISGIKSEIHEFKTTEELLNIDIVKKHKKMSNHFTLSGKNLMILSNDGKLWWVLGYIKNPEDVNLPQWKQ